MKQLLKTFTFIGLSLTWSLNAQISSSKVKTQSGSQITPQNEVKSAYVSNQDYLSPNSLVSYSSPSSDSLKGFNEAAVKAELISRYYFGQEFINVMAWRKRDFINAKYKLGDYAPKPLQPVVQQPSGKKPIGGGNMVNVLPCVNEDFEATAPGSYNNVLTPVSGWSVESTQTQGKQLPCGLPTNAAWILGSPEFSIVTTPILGHPYIGSIPNSPLGGSNVALLNNTQPGFVSTRLSTTFPVTQANKVFQFAYAGSWDGSGHACCDQPFFVVTLVDCAGQPLSCSTISLTPPGAACQNGATGYSTTPAGISWTNWQIKYVDLTPYIGSCITLRITNGDCNGGAHHGSLYFDAKCGGNVLCGLCGPPTGPVTSIPGPVSFCAGSGMAQINAPNGYATYSWVAPPNATPIPPAQATLQTLSIQNPNPGDVYTVNLVSTSGCPFVSTNTIVFTSVNIAGVGAAPSCAGGASGSGTVIGNGSGTGYNYNWMNASGNTVGTNSVVNGLAPGVYSIVISGLGAAGCGSAVSTVTVGVAPPGVIPMFKPFCGSSAFITTNGGTNYQWYNNTTPVPGNLGGNLPTFSVNPASNNQIITLTYMSSAGCRDSIRYTLGQTTPGFLTSSLISSVCPGGTNGTAQLNLVPAQGSPPGLNFMSVTSTGNTPPYNSNTVGSPQLTQMNLTGLAAGSYSASAFDGSCFYGITFNVNAFIFNFNLTPATNVSLCPNGSVAGGVSFQPVNLQSQFKYAWYPNNGSIFGPTTPAVVIKPTIPQGPPVSTIYSVVVTPTAINCPQTRTFVVTAYNPVTPTVTAIPPLCNTSPQHTIMVAPMGGTFTYGAFTGAASPIGQGNGIITPSHTNLAVNNTFSYTTSEYLCKITQTGTFQVSKYISPALTTTAANLCVTSPAFNMMNIVQNPGGTWSMVTPGVPGGALTGGGLFSPNQVGTPLTVPYVMSYNIPSTPNPTACPSTTNTSILVTNTLIPTITQLKDFCNSEPQKTLTALPAGGGWIAQTGLSTNGIVTPVNINVHKMTATYTVQIGPCLNTNTTQLTIHKFNSAALTAPVPSLCFNSPPMNLMSIVQNTTGYWYAADPTHSAMIQGNSLSSANKETGTYSIVYRNPSSPDPNLCPDTQTISFNILNPPAPSITAIGPFCNNASPIQLTVTPNKGGGFWVASPYVDKKGMFNPALTAVGKNTIQYISGISTCYKEDIKQVDIEAFVPANIVSDIPDLCNNSPVVNLAPFTLSNLGTWSGSGITGTNFNPATTGSGKFILTHKTASYPSGLCPDVATIAVNVYSLASPVVSQEGPFCNSHKPVQLQVSPVGGIFGGGNMGVISSEGLFNPGSAIMGDNVITYSITSGPCVAYVQSTIKVEEFISADIAKYVGPFCGNEEPVNLLSFVKNPKGQWSQDGNETGLMGDGKMFDPKQAVKGINHLTYRTNSATGRCPDERKVTIEVRVAPEAKIVVAPSDECMPVEVSFNVKDKNQGEGIWTIGDGSDAVKGLAGTHIFNTPGTYTIQFNYSDEVGCKAPTVLSQEIVVHPTPKPDFSTPEEIYISDSNVQLTNLTPELRDNKYSWKAAGMTSTELHPNFNFAKIGKYNVTLTATSAYGCVNEITKTIEVKNVFNVFIPNSFTPNFDGLNDYFMPVFSKEGLDNKSFEMEIFDRWGHSLYHTKDATAKGWDGSVQNKGEPLKEEVYVYRIKYKDLEGNSYSKMGHVSLVR